MTSQVYSATGAMPRQRSPELIDWPLLTVALSLLVLGLVMIGSASVGVAERNTGVVTYYLQRQAIYAMAGLLIAWLFWRLPLHVLEATGPMWVLGSLVFLLVLLVPGIGLTVNGSTRWLRLGPINLQVAELVKLGMVIYIAGYLVRQGEAVRNTVGGFIKPMLLIGLMAVLLLAQPDFGAAVVLMATVMGMMFLGGVRLWLFGLLVAFGTGMAALLAISSPYRMERLTGFLNPWADPFDKGFQLTQALIAFGRGEWFGAGLGGSVQKLFYLPEAHNDFLYAVLAEELGMVGASTVIALFAFIVYRALRIGYRAAQAGMLFGSYLAYGVGIWLALQAFINMGVNMGLLPTKGLTLPLMSYGGSSMVVSCIAIALLLRVDHELRQQALPKRGRKK